jgi:hypothetical protein
MKVKKMHMAKGTTEITVPNAFAVYGDSESSEVSFYNKNGKPVKRFITWHMPCGASREEKEFTPSGQLFWFRKVETGELIRKWTIEEITSFVHGLVDAGYTGKIPESLEEIQTW